ncbi:MAG: ferredoxin family protein [Candidatus Freyrarchaeum guaymaensis]
MVRITVDVDRCVGCGVCRSVCLKGGRIYRIVDAGGRCLAVVMDESSCLGCKLCVSRCPTDAIRIDFGKRAHPRAVEFD